MSYDINDWTSMNPFHHFFDRMHGHAHHHHHQDHGRHAGRRGHAGFGFGPPQGLGGFGQGRKLTSRDLQLLILAMLAEQARHGYELIKELELRSKGYYVPSPGMVYPSLSYLEDAGYASVEADGAKKLYTITVAGLGFLEEQRAAVDAMWSQLTWFGERMDRMRQAFGEDAAVPGEPGRDEAGFASMRGGRGESRGAGRGRGDFAPFPNEMHDALHALRDTLRGLASAPADEQRRIVDILARAAAEIRKR